MTSYCGTVIINEAVINKKDWLMEKFYTVSEVADMLRVSQSTIYKAIYDNELEAYTAGDQWRITQQQIDDFLKRGKTKNKEN